MYIGRIVAVAMAEDGRLCAGYRVSSRSFPNRTAVISAGKVSILPKAGHETDVQRNPYIAYNCVRLARQGSVAVATNGSHTDPIVEKIGSGMSIRDALVLGLCALDYEKDDYNTPRIAAVVDKQEACGWLGVVRVDGLTVRRMNLKPGACFYVATYEENDPRADLRTPFHAVNAEDACGFLLNGGVFAQRSNPVTAVAAFASGDGFELAVKDAD